MQVMPLIFLGSIFCILDDSERLYQLVAELLDHL